MANGIFDSLIALRILYMLTQDIKKLPAYKLGLVSETGEILRKAKTSEEKHATSMLLRLVLRIRHFISMVPGGSTKIGSIVAAYALVKECYDNDNFTPTLGQLDEALLIIEQRGYVSDIHDKLDLFEDAVVLANTTGPQTSTNEPVVRKRKKAAFTVSDKTFGNFKNGKAKFRRWGNYLNLDDDVDQEVYKYAKANPRGILVLQDQKGNSKGIRYSKHGGGNWHGIKRKPKEIVSESTDFIEMEVVHIC